MNFNDYTTSYQVAKRIFKTERRSFDAFYADLMPIYLKDGSTFAWWHGRFDVSWNEAERPYYNIWPAILEAFKKTRLTIPTTCLYELPFDSLLLRLPMGNHCLDGDDYPVKTISVQANLKMNRKPGEYKDPVPGLSVMVDAGEAEETPWGDMPICSFRNFSIPDDMTIEDALHAYDNKQPDDPRIKYKAGKPLDIPEEHWTDIVRVVVSCCLISRDDESLMQPDILSKDRLKARNATKEEMKRFQERAKKRGKNGWDLGRDLEVIPHYRRPHFGWRLTGPGRTIPKFVPIKGAIVHREQVKKIPTGHLGKQN